MFSARSRIWQNPTFKKYIPLFLALQLTFLLFLGCLSLILRVDLMAYCKHDVTRHLNEYLSQRADGVLVSTKQTEGLNGLAFVRLVGKNEQSFYTDSPDAEIDFESIINLDPHSSAIWISLTRPKQRGSWAIVAQKLKNGNTLQAGIEYRHIVLMYDKLIRILVIIGGFSVFISLLLTYYCRKKSLESVRVAEESLNQIVSSQSRNSLPINSADNELANLYAALNQLILQNRQLIKEMQESLDNVAHDLRTPITRLRSVAEYGLQQNSPDKLVEALSDCLEESERVSSMLGIMMSVVEAESGTIQLVKEEVQLYGTIADVISLYEYVADERGINLQMHVSSDIMLEADKTRITQVWANIIDNGIKYGHPGGYVKISATQENDKVSIFFEDDGIGISANEIERIWERLFRGDRSRTQQGLGLGLNYVRAVIEAHGGEVLVTSTLGEGSCFEVVFSQTQGDL